MNLKAKIMLLATAALLLCGGTKAQDIKVDYTKYPDANPYATGKTMSQTTAPTVNTGSTRSSIYGKTRPDHVNNALTKYYPPVFNQDGGSCGSAQAVGYCMTYDMNAYRNTNAQFEENMLPTHFTWLHTECGIDKYSIMNKHGVPSVTDYGGRTYSRDFGNQDSKQSNYGYMQGYDKWYRAMFNRTVGGDTFCDGNQMTELGREQLKQWLWNHWGDEDFYAGGVSGIGVASGGIWGKILSTPANQAAGVVGKYCVTSWGKSYDHALTICGYDDRIEFDLDSNGVFGEKDKDEVGAWIICNSWGAGWCNSGFIYCPYKYSYAIGTNTLPMNSGHYTWRKNYAPQRTLKILMDYSHRSEICISAGIAADTSATTPEVVEDMPYFRYAGDGTKSNPAPKVPLLGSWKGKMHTEPMEFGYDVTDLSAKYNLDEPIKYFLQIKSKPGAIGSGKIYKLSLMDYSLEPQGMEIPAVIDTVEVLNGGQTTLVAVTVPAKQVYQPLNASLNGQKLTWSKPKASSYAISRYYIYKGQQKIAEVPDFSTSYIVDDASATYYVAAAYAYKTQHILSAKSNPARNAAPPAGDEVNKTLVADNAAIHVPGLLKDGLKQATIEFWIKPTTVNNNQHIGEGWGSFLVQATNSGQIQCGWDANNRVASAANTIKPGTWAHVAIVVDYNTITLYVNSLKKGSFTSDTYSGIPALKNFYIGCPNNGIGTLNAEIDEFRVWNCARSQAALLKNRGLAVANPSAMTDLVAYYPMTTGETDGQLCLKDMASGYDAPLANVTTAENSTLLSGTTTAPTATFDIPDGPIYAGDPVIFKSAAMVNTVKWEWNAAGATTAQSSMTNPFFTFAQAGEYEVTHTITNTNGETATETKTITVINPDAPKADFAIANSSMNEGDMFCFANLSAGANCTYAWSMPGADKEDMHSVNATATYSQTGTFPVTLTVSNAGGTATCTKYVTVAHSAPTVAFSVDPSTIYLGETTYLADESRNNPDTWKWTLSNGTHTYIINGQLSSFTPDHPGCYDITLEATNDIGTSSLCAQNKLMVINADSKNGLNFTGNERLTSTANLFGQGTKAFTIEWWMNPSDMLGALNMTTSNNQFSATTDINGNMSITVGDKSVNSGEDYVIAGEWHHYAITFSFGTVKFYRDGVLIASPSSRIGTSTTDWGKLNISTGEDLYKGQLDELRIWSKSLSLSNMKENINAPLNDIDKLVASNGLVAYYDFNQNGGSVIDRTSNHIDLNRQGFGPDGDAWGLSLGVFSLDLDAASDPVSIEADGLTSIYESVKADKLPQFSAVKNGIRMICEEPTIVTIYSADGNCWLNDTVEGVHTLPFHPGIYIVNGHKLLVE